MNWGGGVVSNPVQPSCPTQQSSLIARLPQPPSPFLSLGVRASAHGPNHYWEAEGRKLSVSHCVPSVDMDTPGLPDFQD